MDRLALALLAFAFSSFVAVRAQSQVLVEVVDGQVLPSEQHRSYQARWEMDSLAELSQSWWHWSNASTTIENGLATIGGSSYEEWMQRDDQNQSLWWDTIDPIKGFRIETRMRVQQAECGGVGLWIHDGRRMFKVHFCVLALRS